MQIAVGAMPMYAHKWGIVQRLIRVRWAFSIGSLEDPSPKPLHRMPALHRPSSARIRFCVRFKGRRTAGAAAVCLRFTFPNVFGEITDSQHGQRKIVQKKLLGNRHM